MGETDFQNRMILDLCRKYPGLRLFRNNVGVCVRTGPDGKQRVTRYGLAIGSGDAIGWLPVQIKQDMVGETLARFVSVEFKTERGRTTEAQIKFRDAVLSAGGVGLIIRQGEDVVL